MKFFIYALYRWQKITFICSWWTCSASRAKKRQLTLPKLFRWRTGHDRYFTGNYIYANAMYM